MRKLAALILITSVGACAPKITAPDLSRASIIELSKSQKELVYKGVRESLKDPDSAKFGTMKSGVDEKNLISVCGYVNSKNSYGGYVGMTRFLGVINPETNNFGIVDIADSSGIELVCERLGLS